MGCPRTFCAGCDGELIHRDNRHGHESSSGFGQIVHRELPRDFTFGDLDGVVRVWLGQLDGRTLLRLIEHKQPGMKFEEAQKRFLRDLARVLEHAIACEASPFKLHPESGLFVIYGEIKAESNGRRKTFLAGPQRIYRIESFGMTCRQHQVAVTRSHEELHRWLTAGCGKTPPSWWPARTP